MAFGSKLGAMFISVEQLKESVEELHEVHPFFGIAFLGFKLAELPVGSTKSIIFSNVMEAVLQRYYCAAPTFNGFYSPFLTSSENRWLSARYGSTSMQRIVSDTFPSAFIHEKRQSKWGWSQNYLAELVQHLNKRFQCSILPLVAIPRHRLATRNDASECNRKVR